MKLLLIIHLLLSIIITVKYLILVASTYSFDNLDPQKFSRKFYIVFHGVGLGSEVLHASNFCKNMADWQNLLK
jgi:hypothetical protein